MLGKAQPPLSNTDGKRLLLAEGPWEHLTVNAAGVNFHVAQAGPHRTDHAVVLVHAFGRTWYQWRDVIDPLAQAGHRVLAMDLRGFGASDLQPHGMDPVRMAADVVAVVSALGISQFTLVGQALGGVYGWLLAARQTTQLRSLVAVSSPHPMGLWARHPRNPLSRAGAANLGFHWPIVSARRLANGKMIDQQIRAWAYGPNVANLLAEAAAYRYAFSRTFAAQRALTIRNKAYQQTAQARKSLGMPIHIPVLSVQGREDRRYLPPAFSLDHRYTTAPLPHVSLDKCGHWVSEEAPEALSETLLQHLETLG